MGLERAQRGRHQETDPWRIREREQEQVKTSQHMKQE